MSFEYRVTVTGSGGEFCLGSIRCESGDYWVTQTRAELVAHLSGSLAVQIDQDGNEVSMPEWFESHDLMHTYGIEHIDGISVRDVHSGSEVLSLDQSSLGSVQREHDELELSENFYSYDGYRLFTRSRERGTCSFSLSTSQPFDAKWFELVQVEFWDHSIINALLYDGEALDMEEGFSKSSDEHDLLLRSPDGKLWFQET